MQCALFELPSTAMQWSACSTPRITSILFPLVRCAKLVPNFGRLRHKFYRSTALTGSCSLGFPASDILHIGRLDLPSRRMIRYEESGFAQVGGAQIFVV
jgi:hypothetical protein